MQRIVGKELAPITPYFEAAAKIAALATCRRAKCGSVIVKDGIIIGTGYNSPPLNDETRRTCGTVWNYSQKPKYDKTCCIHAEWRAILNACKNHANKIEGSILYFMRIGDSGNFTEAGVPFCTTCSRLAMEAGISQFVLWNKGAADIYPVAEYDQRSYDFYKI